MTNEFSKGSRERRVKDKDLFETVEEVFDTKTVMTIYELMKRRVLRRVNGVISAGKEARVYLAYSFNKDPLAVKIYLTSTAEFRKGIIKYIAGDPRFNGVKLGGARRLIYLWAKKEFRNLKRMHEVGVRVPKPIAVLNNVLVMEFIGEEGLRYPLLKEVWKDLSREELLRVYELLIEDVKKMYCLAKLVHADLSEFNVMIKPGGIPVIIDVSQSVNVDHPHAEEFLVRDIRNIYGFFHSEVGLEVTDFIDILEEVRSCRGMREDSSRE
ncbi:MAG: serine protein kinase RIO [Sulfolobales archaeon]|nr:serine protein kinase RIO [Sulfolobales archaeon]MCX8199514.1 serine protein kinase RIO [Sulfolobales archaeon]MDW8170467.1 serine protein kinase RIO [Desulfurococcaceae archaeon]